MILALLTMMGCANRSPSQVCLNSTSSIHDQLLDSHALVSKEILFRVCEMGQNHQVSFQEKQDFFLKTLAVIERISEGRSSVSHRKLAQVDSEQNKTGTIHEKVASQAPSDSKSQGKYMIQIASYKTESEARAHTKKLNSGDPQIRAARYIQVTLNGTQWFRVGIGAFRKYREAVHHQKELHRQDLHKDSFIQPTQ